MSCCALACHYTAIIQTSVVCGVSVAATQQTGLSVISSQCGGGIYNLSGAITQDIVGTAGGSNYAINLCGALSSTNACGTDKGATSSICQSGNLLATYQPNAYPVVWTYNGFGLTQFMQDGLANCPGSEERATNVTLVCSLNATTPQIVNAQELPSQCHYQITILTNAVCGAPLFGIPTQPVPASSSAAVSISTVSSSALGGSAGSSSSVSLPATSPASAVSAAAATSVGTTSTPVVIVPTSTVTSAAAVTQTSARVVSSSAAATSAPVVVLPSTLAPTSTVVPVLVTSAPQSPTSVPQAPASTAATPAQTSAAYISAITSVPPPSNVVNGAASTVPTLLVAVLAVAGLALLL